MSNRGRRFDNEPKLNIKKVIAVIIAIAVLVMIVIAIKNLITNSKEKGKVISTSYFTVLTNDRWGVIDNTGNIIINPTYEEMIIIPNNKTDIFICMYDVNYTDNTYKTRILNKKGEELFKQFELVEAIENYDKQNNIWYEDNVLRVKKDGKFGVINFEGKEVLSIRYDSIVALKGTSEVILAQRDGKYGTFDLSGNMLAKAEFEAINVLDENNKNNFIVKKYEKYGIAGIDEIEVKYEEIKPVSGNNMYVVKENAVWKIIKNDGTTVLESDFGDVEAINSENITISKNGKFGVINTKGEQVIPAEYEKLTYAFSNCYIAKKDNKYGIINTANETKLEIKYTNVTYTKSAEFIEAWLDTNEAEIFGTDFNLKLKGVITDTNIDKGYMRVRIGSEYKYYNFKFEEKKNTEVLSSNTLFLDKKDGKYGFIDKDGNVKVEYVYDDATEQNSSGYAAVKKDGKWGSININGKISLEPKYSLENNLTIDFIDKWHIGEDLNMNYYTDKQ